MWSNAKNIAVVYMSIVVRGCCAIAQLLLFVNTSNTSAVSSNGHALTMQTPNS